MTDRPRADAAAGGTARGGGEILAAPGFDARARVAHGLGLARDRLSHARTAGGYGRGIQGLLTRDPLTSDGRRAAVTVAGLYDPCAGRRRPCRRRRRDLCGPGPGVPPPGGRFCRLQRGRPRVVAAQATRCCRGRRTAPATPWRETLVGRATPAGGSVLALRGGRGEEALIAATERALRAGIAAVRPGARVGDISHAIGSVLREEGYAINTEFAGHGIGSTMHQGPHISNTGALGRGHVLKPGLLLALEPWVREDTADLVTDADGWTLRSAAGCRTAHSEHTVAVTLVGAEMLTAPAAVRA